MPIVRMSQLQYLEIVNFDHSLPARSFIPLGSLSQLKSLKIGTSFFPYCSLQENDEDDPDFGNEILLSVDSYNMFSGLTALEHLSTSAHQDGHPHTFGGRSLRIAPDLALLDL